jgi:hypothetical protein
LLVAAFVAIVLLTWILVGMNTVAVIRQFQKDQNVVRLYSFLATLLVLGSLIIGVSSAIVQRVIDAEAYLHSDDDVTPVRHFHR